MSEPRARCPLCGAGNLVPRGRFTSPPLARCASCGHTTAALVPTREELDANYAEYERVRELSEVTVIRYDELLDSLDRFRQLNRLMDFGCGSGEFLLSARKHGWEVDGVELDEEAIRVCTERGLEIEQEIESFPDDSFDVVTAIEVVEHLEDPISSLREFRRVLRPGGAAYLTTPNFSSLTRRVLGPRWRIISYPEHLQYFTRRALIRAARTAGFEVARIDSTGVSPRDVIYGLSGGRAATEGQGGGLDETLRQRAEQQRLAAIAKRVINWGLTRTGAGDTLKALLVAG